MSELQVVGADDVALSEHALIGLELLRDERVDRRLEAVGARDVEEVDGPLAAVERAVAEHALLRLGLEDVAALRAFARRVDLLVVGEEEQLVAEDRAADSWRPTRAA